MNEFEKVIELNEGEWFGRTWLVFVHLGGMSVAKFEIEASCEQDAIDELTDSEYGHLIIKTEDIQDDDPRGGSCGLPLDLDNVWIDKTH